MPKIREADKGELTVGQYTGNEALPISSGSSESKYVTTATIGLAALKPWSKITDTPTTLDGYGISELQWSKITGAPTTLSGYGITDLQNVHFVSQYASLAAALSAIGSAETTLFIDESVDVSTDTTIPSTLSIMALKGGVLVRTGGDHLTINGPFECGNWQCFIDNTSTHDWVIFGNIDTVRSVWFGDLTPDQIYSSLLCSLQSDAVLKFSNKEYSLTSGFVLDSATLPSGSSGKLRIRGTRPKEVNYQYDLESGTVFKLSGSDFVLFDVKNLPESDISNIGIEGSGTSQHTGVRLDNCTNSKISDINIVNSKYGIITFGQNNYGLRFEGLGLKNLNIGVEFGEGANTCYLKNSRIEWCEVANVRVTNESGAVYSTSNVTISDCNLEGTTGSAILVDPDGIAVMKLILENIYTEGNEHAISIGTRSKYVYDVDIQNITTIGTSPQIILDRVSGGNIVGITSSNANPISTTSYTKNIRFENRDWASHAVYLNDMVNKSSGVGSENFNWIPDSDFTVAYSSGRNAPMGSQSQWADTTYSEILMDSSGSSEFSPYWKVKSPSGWNMAGMIEIEVPAAFAGKSIYYGMRVKAESSVASMPYPVLQEYYGGSWHDTYAGTGQISTSWQTRTFLSTLNSGSTAVRFGVYVHDTSPCLIDSMFLSNFPNIGAKNPISHLAVSAPLSTGCVKNTGVSGITLSSPWSYYFVSVTGVTDANFWVEYSGKSFTVKSNPNSREFSYVCIPLQGDAHLP